MNPNKTTSFRNLPLCSHQSFSKLQVSLEQPASPEFSGELGSGLAEAPVLVTTMQITSLAFLRGNPATTDIFKAKLKIFPGTGPAPAYGEYLGTGLTTMTPLSAKYPSRQVHRTTLGWPKPPPSQSPCPVCLSCWLMLSVHPLSGHSKGCFTQSLKREGLLPYSFGEAEEKQITFFLLFLEVSSVCPVRVAPQACPTCLPWPPAQEEHNTPFLPPL